MATNDRVIEVADLLGLAFVEHGTDPRAVGEGGNGGVDCWGLARLVLTRVGVELPENPIELMCHYGGVGRKLGRSEPDQAGDVVVWPTGDEGELHVGVVIGGGRFIQAVRERGVMVCPLHNWRHRFTDRVRPRALEGERA